MAEQQEQRLVSPSDARVSWWRKPIEPILALLRSGLSVDEIAKALALGCTTGTSPLIGTTTLTGGLLAVALRLNPVACLAASYGAYPLQIALVLPFAKLGQQLTGWNNLPLDPSQIRDLFQQQGLATIEILGPTMVNATIAWLLCTPIIFVTTYFLFRRVLRPWSDGPEC